MSEENFKNSAHDLNNILTSIVNGIELLKNYSSQNEENKKIISNLEKSAQRAYDIVHAYLSTGTRENIEKVLVTSVINEVVESFSDQEKTKITFDDKIDDAFILIDSTDLFRVTQNLVKNAIEAIADDGKIEISLDEITRNDRKYISLSVTDNGEGIAQDNLSKIFEPKFSTKSKAQDSGFGLSSVKEKVEKYNGLISVKSEPGKTIFEVSFPKYSATSDSVKNILLAEDDISVSEVLSDLLETQGYDVSIAATGHEAITELNKKLFDALIIDKKMPEMDGIECIKSIRNFNKDIPIILASGSNIDMDVEELGKLKIGLIIKKPYNFPEILSALQKFNL